MRPRNIYLTAAALLATAFLLAFVVAPHLEGQLRTAVEYVIVTLATVSTFFPLVLIYASRGTGEANGQRT